MRVSSLRSIKANYKHLMEFYDTFSSTDYSATAQAKGFLSKMQSFDFLFFLNFSIALLGPIEILNAELQSPKLSVVDSYKKINLTVDLLKGTKETLFEKIWIECQTEMEELDVNDPVLPRKRKLPSKLGGNDIPVSTPKSFFCNLYEKCFDSVLESFDTRFNKETQKTHKSLEKLLLGLENIEEKKQIECLYKDDIDFKSFYIHRQMFFEFLKIRKVEFPRCLGDVVDFFTVNSEMPGMCPIYSKFVKLILTIPGSSCTNERSFSLMKRIKTYMRSTMKQDRLNDIALLTTYKEAANQINLDEVIDDFINKNGLRKATFSLTE